MGFYYSESMRDAYNRMALKYHSNREIFNLSELYSQLKNHLPESGALLDLGCGAGDSVALYFAQDGWQIDGFDISEEMLKLAKSNNPVMNLSCCDLCDVSLEREKYHAAISVYALFHLPINEQFKLFEKVYGSLQNGGVFFFTYGIINHSTEVEKEEIVQFMGEELFYAQSPQTQVVEKLETLGFKIISIEKHYIGGESFYWYTVKK